MQSLGSQEPGKNIPYGTLYPKTSEPHMLATVLLLENAPCTRPSKATQRHPFPRYMPPTHFWWRNSHEQSHLDPVNKLFCLEEFVGDEEATFSANVALFCATAQTTPPLPSVETLGIAAP